MPVQIRNYSYIPFTVHCVLTFEMAVLRFSITGLSCGYWLQILLERLRRQGAAF